MFSSTDKVSRENKVSRPNSVYIPTPLSAVYTNSQPATAAVQATAKQMADAATYTYNEEFMLTTSYVYDMAIVSYDNRKYLRIHDQYFPYSDYLGELVQQVQHNIDHEHEPEKRTDILEPERSIIHTNATPLHTVNLYKCHGNTRPTMYVYNDIVIDINVPLYIIFTTEETDQFGPSHCQNCTSYCSYRGVFISVCANCCAYSTFPDDFGFSELMCCYSLYNIHPQIRHKALPSYMRYTRLEDIGYTGLITTSCSAIKLEVTKDLYDSEGCHIGWIDDDGVFQTHIFIKYVTDFEAALDEAREIYQVVKAEDREQEEFGPHRTRPYPGLTAHLEESYPSSAMETHHCYDSDADEEKYEVKDLESYSDY
jgi:hypothetical protein